MICTICECSLHRVQHVYLSCWPLCMSCGYKMASAEVRMLANIGWKGPQA